MHMSNLTVYILLNETPVDVRTTLACHNCICLDSFPDECLKSNGENVLKIM